MLLTLLGHPEVTEVRVHWRVQRCSGGGLCATRLTLEPPVVSAARSRGSQGPPEASEGC